MRSEEFGERCDLILSEVERAVIGKRDALELVLLGLLADGHVLIEDYPGLAKTLIARSFAQVTSMGFARIQFTPDLMPSDVTGASIFDQRAGEFDFRPGPIFTNLLLADEINRAPPKTQAALLEAMQERQVTSEGVTRPLDRPFLVLATQNPIEYEGTYPLPEAQLDRFLLKVVIDYPNQSEERRILQMRDGGFDPHELDAAGVRQVLDAGQLSAVRSEIDAVRVEPGVLDYILAIVRSTRKHRSIALGASPRAGIALLTGSKALAAIRGRNYITPDEVKTLSVPVLLHRLLLTPESELEGGDVTAVINSLVGSIAVPR